MWLINCGPTWDCARTKTPPGTEWNSGNFIIRVGYRSNCKLRVDWRTNESVVMVVYQMLWYCQLAIDSHIRLIMIEKCANQRQLSLFSHFNATSVLIPILLFDWIAFQWGVQITDENKYFCNYSAVQNGHTLKEPSSSSGKRETEANQLILFNDQ